MRRVLMIGYGLYAWLLLVLTVLVTTALLLIVPGLRRRRHIARTAARLLFRLTGIPITLQGESLTDIDSSVVVSNHCSYLDGIILTAILPPEFSFMVKREMNAFPVANWMLRRLGTEFVERFDSRRGARDARRVIRVAARGQGIAAFPEGTFRSEPGLGEFYSGAFSAAVRSGMTVVPLTIRGSREILPADRLLPRPGKLGIIVHPGIEPDVDARRGEMLRIKALARESILSALDEPALDFRLARQTAAND